MSGRLVLATRNPGKVVELRRILVAEGCDVELVGTDAFPGLGEVPETGRSFEENAILKARATAAATGLPAVADDSGLCVDALNGMPGIFSARWAGRHGDDKANLDLLLAQLRDLPDERRGAQFVCAAALALPTGAVHVTDAVLTGWLVREPHGTGGFGYDPIFVPEGETRTTAELSSEEKDAISHRGQALRALAPAVRALVGDARR